MEKKIYYKKFIGVLSSFPRALLFVFLREKFGERAIGLGTILIPAFFLIALPLYEWTFLLLNDIFGTGTPWQIWTISIYTYLGWVIFTVLFIRRGMRHWRESRPPKPNTYNFSRYSYFEGYINPRFYNADEIRFGTLQFCPRKPDIRDIECYLEPLAGLLLGTALILLGQRIGHVLVFCSWIYCLHYALAYDNGHRHVLDMIDNIIIAESDQESFSTVPSGEEDEFLTETEMQDHFGNANQPPDKIFSVE